MKKIITTLLFLSGIYFKATAQTDQGLEFGVTAGINIANITNGTNSTSYKAGFTGGLTGEYYFSDRWSIKAKALYDQKGWANGYIQYGTAPSVSTNYTLNYITIPLMANYHVNESRNLYFDLGPYIGFLLSAKESAMGTDVKSVMNSTDAGIAYGLGLKFNMGESSKFFVELEGQSGVNDLAKGSNSLNTTVNNREALCLGILF